MQELNFVHEITPEDYLSLRKEVGWKNYPLEQARTGLSNTAYVIAVRDGERTVAVTRLLWDGGYSAFISDVIVSPEYQGRGIGRKMLEDVIDYLEQQLQPGYRIMITLLSAHGKEEFYQKFDFTSRPTETFGPGMHRWLDKEGVAKKA